MMILLKNYESTVGKEVIGRIERRAAKLKGRHIVAISSTYQGGGVAEMLNSMVVLFNQMGIRFGWRILHGSPDFFTVTKKFHNALQGGGLHLSENKKHVYLSNNERYSTFTHLGHELVIVHDPQPLPIISYYDKKQPWVWRCHVDLSKPNPELFRYLRHFINMYDRVVISHKDYKQDLRPRQDIIMPAIDPLSNKNKRLQSRTIAKFLGKHHIRGHRPIIAQISRFDKWKDPLGVIDVFERVRENVDCRLVLLGNLATDDPEGLPLFHKVEEKARRSKFASDIHIICEDNTILVNALQRTASVVIQKSLKEGFGLTVTEAMWKGTPVVASSIGGIPLQITDGVTGFLHKPKDKRGFARSIEYLLTHESERKEMGHKAREHVRENFLITRLIEDWLKLISDMLGVK